MRRAKSAVAPSRRRRPLPPGLAPGTLVVHPHAQPTTITLMDYGPEPFEERSLERIDDLAKRAPEITVRWLDVVGLADVERLKQLGERFDLHALLLEDVVNTHQRPKVEAFGEDVFIIARMGYRDEDSTLLTEQISMLVRQGLVITFQERPGDGFEPVRERIRGRGPRLRNRGADYLAYALLDALVDAYMPLLESYGERLEAIEDEVLGESGTSDIRTLHRVRRDLIALRKAVVPLREALYAVLREHSGVFVEETQLFLRDCYDHAIRTLDTLDGQRELAASLMDMHLSLLGHRTNEVMKVLTIIATIFIPLGFIAGLYGMNFDTSSPWNMPELGFRFGYPAAILVMITVVLGFLWFFRRKGWL